MSGLASVLILPGGVRPSGWIGEAPHDVLQLPLFGLAREALARFETERDLREARRVVMLWAKHRGGDDRRATRLQVVRRALYLRELLRRDEEARLREHLVDDEQRRWPDRDPRSDRYPWVPVLCDRCDYTLAAFEKLRDAVEAARKAWWAAPRGSAEERDASFARAEAEAILLRTNDRWTACPGSLVLVRRRALWEQTPEAMIDLFLEAWAAADAWQKRQPAGAR